MPSCSVSRCGFSHRKIKSATISYFKFPKEEESCIQWYKVCCKKNMSLKTATICSEHFDESAFQKSLQDVFNYSPRRYRCLKPDAMPVLHLPNVSMQHELSEKEIEAIEKWCRAGKKQRTKVMVPAIKREPTQSTDVTKALVPVAQDAKISTDAKTTPVCPGVTNEENEKVQSELDSKNSVATSLLTSINAAMASILPSINIVVSPVNTGTKGLTEVKGNASSESLVKPEVPEAAGSVEATKIAPANRPSAEPQKSIEIKDNTSANRPVTEPQKPIEIKNNTPAKRPVTGPQKPTEIKNNTSAKRPVTGPQKPTEIKNNTSANSPVTGPQKSIEIKNNTAANRPVAGPQKLIEIKNNTGTSSKITVTRQAPKSKKVAEDKKKEKKKIKFILEDVLAWVPSDPMVVMNLKQKNAEESPTRQFSVVPNAHTNGKTYVVQRSENQPAAPATPTATNHAASSSLTPKLVFVPSNVENKINVPQKKAANVPPQPVNSLIYQLPTVPQQYFLVASPSQIPQVPVVNQTRQDKATSPARVVDKPAPPKPKASCEEGSINRLDGEMRELKQTVNLLRTELGSWHDQHSDMRVKYEKLLKEYENFKVQRANDILKAKIDLLSKFLTPGQMKVVLGEGQKTQVQWTLRDMNPALKLHSISPEAYEFLRSNMKYPLPAPDSLQRFKAIVRRAVLPETETQGEEEEISGKKCEEEMECSNLLAPEKSEPMEVAE